MFGIRKNKIEERINEVFEGIKERRDDFETRVSSMTDSGTRVYEDLSQVTENTKAVAEHAIQNVEEEASAIHTMDECAKEFKTAYEEYQKITDMVKENYESVVKLVEENKHYTTPSKYLTEAPARLKKEYKVYEAKTEVLADGARQMSVKALNAAIEAGRMGEVGKQFVEVAEDIRKSALEYETEAMTLKEELQSSKEKIQELEEVVLRLVSLIKDGNVSTTRLMKKSMELNKNVLNCSMYDFSEPMQMIRDKVVSMRNLDEEILKLSERNKIQLSDVQEELQTQKQTLSELESDLSHLMDEAQKKIRK